ncbi:MAG: DsbA family protein [Alphaproteobacteria bacterium]|nr:DsbA family protein [Alphaproteobacteria bacterium]
MKLFLLGAALAITFTGAALAKMNFEIKPDDRTLGNPNANVTLIEYAAFTCPHCAAFNEQVFPQLKKNYIDNGKVFYVFRLFARGPQDGLAEKLARCAPREKYFTMTDVIFRSQPKWDYEFGIQDGRAQLVKLGQEMGLKADQINACMDSSADNGRINANGQEAVNRYGLTGTPTFVINGKALESGALPYDELAKKLDQAAR